MGMAFQYNTVDTSRPSLPPVGPLENPHGQHKTDSEKLNYRKKIKHIDNDIPRYLFPLEKDSGVVVLPQSNHVCVEEPVVTYLALVTCPEVISNMSLKLESARLYYAGGFCGLGMATPRHSYLVLR